MAKEKKHIALDQIPKKDVYRTPEGYFESLPDQVLQKIDREDTGKERRLGEVSWKMIGYAAAASVVLLAVVFIGFQDNDDVRSPEDLLAEVSTSDLVQYLQYSELETYEIVESADPDNWEQPLEGAVNPKEPQFDEADMDLLYERYGVSPDENLQTF